MNIELYQNLSKIFLGLTSDLFLQTLSLEETDQPLCGLNQLNDKPIEAKLAEILYYQLDREDPDFNRKFHSNLALCNKIQDKPYLDWMIQLAKAVKPDLDGQENVDNLKTVVFKPKPKIVKKELIIKVEDSDKTNTEQEHHNNTCKPKTKIITIKKERIKKDKKTSHKKNNVFELPIEVYCTPSAPLWTFMTKLNAVKDLSNRSVPIALIKETINKYIYDKDLQDLTQRSIIHLDDELKVLFEAQLNAATPKGKTDITYMQLRDYIQMSYSKYLP
jgi:hypothetical protein